ncbi:MAG: hypothetical protein QXN21_04875 [Candidatus Bathyarchaeia archaeon]
MGGLARIVVSKYGRIPDEELSLILEVMNECYNRLMPHEVSLVDLYIFESFSLVESFIMRERMSLGVSTTPFLEETFFAMHDAWRGIPRIILSLDKLRVLPELVKAGGIRHEVGHTVLHGSLQYYLLAFPTHLLWMMNEFNLPPEYARDILYLVSIAVKDYEVTRLLYRRGYIVDQVEYIKFLLKESGDEILSWSLSRGSSFLESMHVASLLKVVGCAAPLLMDKNFGNEIKVRLTRYLSHLPEDLSKDIVSIAERNFMELGDDTFQNISSMIEKCNFIFSKIFRRQCKQNEQS